MRPSLFKRNPPPVPAAGDDKTPSGKQARSLVLRLVSQGVIMFMLIAGGGYAIYSLVSGSSLFIPRSAAGVLDSVDAPREYEWSSESVRLVTLAGVKLRQDGLRWAHVDLTDNRFYAMTTGTLPERTVFDSDGKLSLALTESNQKTGAPWSMISDACNGAPALPASLLALPSPADLKRLTPQIETDKGAYLGTRAWILGFKPDQQLISRLLWLQFLGQAGNASDQRWVLSKRERAALSNGDFDVDTARAWVTRSPRKLVQIELRFRFTIPGGSKWHLLARLMSGKIPSLRQHKLGRPSCGSTVGTPATTTPSPTSAP